MNQRARERSITSILLEIVGPALIMVMVGSLVWFLVAMFYRGPHEGRLCLVLALFVFAAVLVSRIGVSEGRERAALFAAALAIATFITSSTLVTFESAFGFLEPVALVGFIGLALWSVNRLTWDCTVVDRSRDVSAIGLTEVVKRKLLGQRKNDQPSVSSQSEPAGTENGSKPVLSDAQAGNLLLALITGGQQKNTPGLWVFYFSFFALPLFAFGQWFVPASHQGYVINLFGAYLTAGLGLMTTTSLLGLQRYLNQRNVELPYHVAVPWMVVGGGVGLVALAVVLSLPRWNVDSSVRNSLAWFGSKQRGSSDYALGSDGQEQRKGANQKRSDLKPGESAADGKSEHQGGRQPGKQQQGAGGTQKGSGQSSKSQSQSSGQSNNSSPQKQNQSAQSNPTQNQNQNQNQPQSNSQNTNQNSPADKQQQSQSNQSAHQKTGETENRKGEPESKDSQSQQFTPEDPNVARDRARQEAAERKREQDEQKQKSNSAQSSAPFQGSSQSSTQSSEATSTPNSASLNQAAGMITSLIYLLGLAAIVLAAILFRKELLAAWRDLLAALRAWFSGKPATATDATPVAPRNAPVRRKSFSEFRNPFAAGISLAIPDLINYTFSALEALGSDQNWPRSPDLTPLEFAETAITRQRILDPSARELAHLVGQLHFAREQLKDTNLETLRQIWQLMDRVHASVSEPPKTISPLVVSS